MTLGEFVDWMAYFTLEQEDRQRAMEDAEDRRKAQEIARQMAGFR